MKLTLLCAVGMSPAIVTETLWSLLQRAGAAGVPVDVHIVTTKLG